MILSSRVQTGNTKGASITLLLTSCLTGLESAVWHLTIFVFIYKTGQSKQVKQEVNGTVILPLQNSLLQMLTPLADEERAKRNDKIVNGKEIKSFMFQGLARFHAIGFAFLKQGPIL
jgi:hypothetical protein